MERSGKILPPPHDSMAKGGPDVPGTAIPGPAGQSVQSMTTPDAGVSQSTVFDNAVVDPKLQEQLRQNGVGSNYTCVVVASSDPVETTAQIAGYLSDKQIPWEPLNSPPAGLLAGTAGGGFGKPDPTQSQAEQKQADTVQNEKSKDEPPAVLSQLATGSNVDQLRTGATERLIVARNMTRAQAAALNASLNEPARPWQNARLVEPGDAQTKLSIENMARPDREARTATPGDASANPTTAPSTDMEKTPLPEDSRQRERSMSKEASPGTTQPAGVIKPGDELVITIPELKGPGFEVRNVVKVSEAGTVELPMLDPIECNGLTGQQLQEEIRNKYRRSKLAPEIDVKVEVPTTQPQVAQVFQPPEEPRTDVLIWVRSPVATEPSQQAPAQQPGQTHEPPSTQPANPAATPSMQK
jgi:hypothetical protein